MSEESRRSPGGLRPGSRLAGYLLEEQVGSDGMTVVYRARNDHPDRRVALKVLAPALARDQSFRARFLRESRAAAAVDHPHILPVLDAGEADGLLYLAVLYVPGGDVRMLLDRAAPLPVARACGLLAQVAGALDAAHARGLVHRDVKPATMLLGLSTGASQPDYVYLTDFGLTQPSGVPGGARFGGPGRFEGTADYAAPEQIQGQPVDGRADQYSLACVGFEMLCGSPPFRREHPMASRWAHLTDPPPSLAACRPELPAEVDEVMATALAKSPADRYASCLDFTRALLAVCGIGVSEVGIPAADAAPPAKTPSAPQARTPGAGTPGAGTPGAGTPGAGTPGAGTPGAGPAAAGTAPLVKPPGTAPPGAKPSGAKPSGAKPSGAKPSGAKPSAAEPSGTTLPGTGPPGTGRPGEEAPTVAGQPPTEVVGPVTVTGLAGGPGREHRRSGGPLASPGAAQVTPGQAAPDSTVPLPRQPAASEPVWWAGMSSSTPGPGGSATAGLGSPASLPPPPGPPPGPRPRRRGPGVAVLMGVVVVLAMAVVAYLLLRGGTRHPRAASTAPTPAPSATASATPSASPRPSSHPPAAHHGPADTVRAYFKAINTKDYAHAWHLGGRYTGSSYSAFVTGFQGTAHDTVKILSVSGNVVTARVAAQQTDGSVQTYQGTYRVSHGVITQFHVVQLS